MMLSNLLFITRPASEIKNIDEATKLLEYIDRRKDKFVEN